jgi:methyl-accepting chemotaxis protein
MSLHLTIKRKLLILAAVAALGPLPIGAVALLELRAALFEGHEVVVADIVQTARAVVDDLQDEVEGGALTTAEAKAQAKRFLRKLRYNEAGDYVFATTGDGTMAVHGVKPELEGRDVLDLRDPEGVPLIAELLKAARAGGGTVRYHWERDGESVPKISYAEFDPEWGWMLATGVYVDDVAAQVRREGLTLAGLMLVVSTVLVVGAMVILRSVDRPLTGIRGAMRRIADGELETDVPFAGRADEIGELASALAVFKDQALERRGLARRLAESFEAEVGTMIDSVADLAGSFEEEGAKMRAAAGEARTQASTGASAATQASANVETVATAAEEMSASIREITARVVESREVAGEASGASDRAGTVLQELHRRAAEIDDFTNLVHGIADQTNLLALNATIEAARAGDAGRGFAVVASEVKTLAGQTNKATNDIAERVQSLRDASARTETELASVNEVIERLVEIAASIASAMEEQSAATAEIARNVQEAATGNQSVSEVITNVADAAGDGDDAAGRVAEAASDLSRQARDLQSRVADFLGNLRAA